MNIEELKSKTISELTNIAKQLKIQGHSGLRKQDLIFKILEANTEKDGLMFVADFFPTFITLAGGNHKQERPIDGIDMTSMLFEGEKSKRTEIVYDVSGSVRLPTIRSGDFKLMGDALYNVRQDPSEQTDVASKHPELVAKLRARVDAVGKRRCCKPALFDQNRGRYGVKEE